MYTTKQIAKRVNKGQNTIRRWVDKYPDLFSADARRVGDNADRLFTEDDLEAVEKLAALTSTGIPIQQAVQQVREQARPSVIDATPSTALPTPAIEPAMPPAITRAELEALPRQMEAMQQRMVRLERHVDLLMTHGVLWGALLGLIAGLGLAALYWLTLYLFAG